MRELQMDAIAYFSAHLKLVINWHLFVNVSQSEVINCNAFRLLLESSFLLEFELGFERIKHLYELFKLSSHSFQVIKQTVFWNTLSRIKLTMCL